MELFAKEPHYIIIMETPKVFPNPSQILQASYYYHISSNPPQPTLGFSVVYS